MRLKFIPFLVGCVLTLGTSSCASLFTKSSQELTFKGIPGTTVVNPKKSNTLVAVVGDNGYGSAKVKKQLKSLDLQATRDGYQPKDIHLGTSIQGLFWCNLLFGGIPGFAIDAATGKMMKFKDTYFDVTLTPTGDKSEAVIEEPVTRQKPGATDAEKAIIRWYFDSDPRGARVFYRVISSVPNEVQNTNETYLTTTPIEETRSFNIPGLTYENSRDVTIEIKVSKRGHEDQVKRYNVRQALDQQEISGFFELVEKK